MQSRNPVLNRIDKEAPPSGSGFAYDEGRNAYQQANTGLATMDAAAAAQTVRLQAKSEGTIRPSRPVYVASKEND